MTFSNRNGSNGKEDQVFADLRASEPYLDDDGFTDAVMQQVAEQPGLQPATRRHRLWVLSLLIGATLSLATLLVTGLPAGEIVQDIIVQVQNLKVFAVAGTLVATLAAAAVIAGRDSQ